MSTARSKSVTAFLVNGDRQSSAAVRVHGLTAHLADRATIEFAYREKNKQVAILRFLKALLYSRPDVTYVVDMAYSGVVGGLLYKLIFRNRLIIDTGDSIYALARSAGSRSKIGLWLTWLLEWCSFHFADEIIVRGTFHKELLSSKHLRVHVIQDGVESELFTLLNVDELRRRYNLEQTWTVGLVGSITWNPKLNSCYGTELVDALSLLRDLPLRGIIIGDGSGLETLKTYARKRGVEDRILFLGRIPYRDLPQYLNVIDICLSTQTNDEVGRVRTTGKLPLYLATGRYVLASRVGEASRLLPESMLVDYCDTDDPEYAKRLALRIRWACQNPQLIHDHVTSRSLAAKHFDYKLLSQRLSAVLENVCSPRA